MGLDTLTHIQALINDISKIKRNHFVPQTDSREDVMLHSSSVALLAWQLFEEIQPLGLDLQKIIYSPSAATTIADLSTKTVRRGYSTARRGDVPAIT